MDNVVIILLVAAIIGIAIWYIVRKKKSGAKCIGCPYSNECVSKSEDSCKSN